jgi:hypothetical protein
MMVKGLEVQTRYGPEPSILPGVTPSSTGVYYLQLSDPFGFWCGCVILAASLTFLWGQRCKAN